MRIRRRRVTTIETDEVLVIRRVAARIQGLTCRACAGRVEMLTPREAARRAGVSQLTVYRWVEDGRVHSAETADGGLFICLAPLALEPEKISDCEEQQAVSSKQ